MTESKVNGIIVWLVMCLVLIGCSDGSPRGWTIENEINTESKWTHWYRPKDDPTFTADYGNNHDSILFYDSQLEYPYHLIISHQPTHAFLWRSKKFSIHSSEWELASDHYVIGNHYEYDDGVRVGDTYYIFEQGLVYTFSGALEDANGQWQATGTFPKAGSDDIGVFYEDEIFHIFGEYGDFPHGPDGTSLSHYTSPTGLGDWTLVDNKAVDANPRGGHKYGVGDATIEKIDGAYYLFSDIESKGNPYKVVAWRSNSLYEPFTFLGTAIEARSQETDDRDNERIQDCDILWIGEIDQYVMSCNMRDIDGVPGGNFPTLNKNTSRVIGFFLSGHFPEETV
ncbi:hypothetical protein LCGC14_2830070 [marine sediment metagenome]|uniref:Glycosyl hydrolase family 32 N-terminal domain-containing protein n=1 Tax=marine sediment metagenome TaxID=412755 RepID=A0A0F9AMT2_9ZZZZ